MGQKINPIGFRLGVTKNWSSKWYANSKNFAALLQNDIKVREFLNKKLANFLIEKASISINGVSLTISKVVKSSFEINVIPHSLKLTNLKNLKTKDLVNVEMDIFCKYIKKYTN